MKTGDGIRQYLLFCSDPIQQQQPHPNFQTRRHSVPLSPEESKMQVLKQ
jgi:hypothetical protein